MKSKKFIYLIIFLLVAASGMFIYYKEKSIKNNNIGVNGVVLDPFSDIKIPEDMDEVTRAVMQIKIDNTKAMYEDKPDIWETWIAIGNLKALLEDYEGALYSYRQSISLHGNNILGYRNIAEVYKNNLQDYEKAREYYSLAIEINPADQELYIAKALVEEFQLKDLTAAENTYLAGLSKTKNNFEILNRLLLFYNRNNNTEKAREIQNKINELYPDSVAALK